MKELIERLEPAEVGSRDLDWLIHSTYAAAYWAGCEWNEFGYVDIDGHPPHPDQITVFKDGRSFYDDMPRYTTSLDAALALAERVLPGWIWQLDIEPNSAWAQGASEPWPEGLVASDRDGVYASADTPALALCIAILKAKSA